MDQSRFSHVNKFMSSQQAAAVSAWVQSAAQRVSRGIDAQVSRCCMAVAVGLQGA